MNRRFAAVALLVFAGTLVAAPIEKSVSVSRQFVVYGGDRFVRAAICDVAEGTKRNLLALLQQRDDWKTPVVIRADRRAADVPGAPAAQTTLSQTGFGLKLQVDLAIGADPDPRDIERALLRAVLTEMMYRGASDTPAGSAYVPPPDWLIEGVLALAPDRDGHEVAATLDALSASNATMSLREFLQQRFDNLESPSRVVYRGEAAALVSMLIESGAGPARLMSYLARLPRRAAGEPLADLQQQFPELGATDPDWSEHWIAAAAHLATRSHGRMLSCEETERELASLLDAAVPDATTAGSSRALEEFATFVGSRAATQPLKHLGDELLALSGRANPIYAPIIAEYRQLALGLVRGKTKRVAEKLARLRGDREEISRRMNVIADYMNWFEATQLRTPSGSFRQYLKAAEIAAERNPRRRDPISIYLDALEAQLGD